MGALCGKESSSSDPFAQPGRTLSSAPPPQTTSSVPASKKVGGPPRTLGGSSNANTSSEDDPAKRAAAAALKRDQAAKKVTGPLGQKSLKERSKSMNTHLKEDAEQNLRRREIEADEEDRANLN